MVVFFCFIALEVHAINRDDKPDVYTCSRFHLPSEVLAACTLLAGRLAQQQITEQQITANDVGTLSVQTNCTRVYVSDQTANPTGVAWCHRKGRLSLKFKSNQTCPHTSGTRANP
mgnify:CR=1 FL=1